MITIEKNDKALFEKALKYNPNLEIKDKEGLTAYMYAKIYLREDMAKRLADLGASTVTTDNSGNNIEDLAIKKNGLSLLLNAISNKDFVMTQKLIDKGITTEADKEVYLKAAIKTDNIQMLEMIVNTGIPLNTVINSNSASYEAGSLKSYTILAYLFEKGIPVKTVKNNYAWLTDLYDRSYKTKNYKSILKVLETAWIDVPDFNLLLTAIIANNDHAFVDQIMATKRLQPFYEFDLWKMQKPFASLTPELAKKYLTIFKFEPIIHGFFLNDIFDMASNEVNMKLYNWYMTDEAYEIFTKLNDKKEKDAMWRMYEQKRCLDNDPQKSIEAFKKNPRYMNFLDELHGTIPLLYFISKNDELMVDYLVNAGANVNACKTVQRKKSYTDFWCPSLSILDSAITLGNKNIIDILKNKGAVSWEDNKHILFVELFYEDFDKLDKLIDKFNINDFIATDSIVLVRYNLIKEVVSVPGQSFFYTLIKNYINPNNSKLIDKLIEKGYKITDNPNNPFLSQKPTINEYNFVEKLISIGAIVDHPFFIENGELSPLYALNKGYLSWQMTELLLKNGANLDAKLPSKNGITIRKYFEEEAKGNKKKYKQFLQLLKKYK